MRKIKKKNNHTIQLFENDCGTAVVASVLKNYGYDVNYVEIKKRINNTDDGTNITFIKKLFVSIGMNSSVYRVPKKQNTKLLAQISNANLPCILMLEKKYKNHYIVLYKISRRGKCIISDPNHPKIEKVYLKELANNISMILSFQKSLELDIPKDLILHKKRSILLDVIRKYNKEILNISLISLVLVVVNLIVSSVFGFIIDGVLPNKEMISSFIVLGLFLVFIVFSLGDASLKYFKLDIVQKLTNSIEHLLYKEYIYKIMHLKNENYRMMKSGEYITRLKEGMKMTELVSTILTNAIVNVLSVILSLMILIKICPILGMINIGVCFISILIVKLFYNRMLYNSYQISDSYAKLDSEIISTLSTIEEIKIFNNEENAQKEIEKLVCNFIMERNNNFNISKTSYTYQNIVIQLSNVMVLSIGAILIASGKLTIGTLVVFMNITNIALGSLMELVNVQLDIETFLVSYKRFLAILNNTECEKMGIDVVESIGPIENIKFLNFSLGFKGKLLLSRIDVEFNKNDENIVIFGESGCGKTTLAKTLIKINDNYNGEIFINGINLNFISEKNIREEIIYLSNVALIKETTIINFLTDGKKVSNKKIINICEDLNIMDFIKNLPGQFNYVISEEGKNISLGQKQRLTIAYALMKNPSVIIFDETFSNIDSGNKEIIFKNLKKYNVLKFFITHQSLPLENQRILEFSNLNIIEKEG